MKKELLLDSFSYLDENLLERSESAEKRVAWQRWAGIAACVALIAALVIPEAVQADPKSGIHISRPRHPGESFASMVRRFNPTDVVEAEDAEKWDTIMENFEPAIVEEVTPSDGEADDGSIANGAMIVWPDNGAAEIPMTPMIEAYKTDGAACYVAPKNGEVGRSVPLRGAMDEYGDGARYRVVVDLFRDEQPLPAEGFEAHDEIDRLAALGYTSGLESYFDHGVLENAYFTIHATYDQLVNFAASADYGYMLYLYAERVPDYDPDLPVIFSPGHIAVDEEPTDLTAVTPPFSGEYLTQEQAYADADLGAYLCEPPAGFGEREFPRMDGVLLASFRRGYDYVDWHVSRDTSDAAIPAADLTPELIAERMYCVDDAGDTDGLRIMNFCVDYGGIFVRVTAKGVTAEWLYSQLSNLCQS